MTRRSRRISSSVVPPNGTVSRAGPVVDDLDGLQPGERVEFGADADFGCFADAAVWTTPSTPFRTFTDGIPGAKA